MSPPEDPEDRIRDLERPLTESARTSELRATPYGEQGWPAPTQPWPAPQPSRGGHGLTTFLVIAGVIVVVITAAVGVYLMSTGGSSNTVSGEPTFSGGGGGFPSTARDATPPTGTIEAPSFEIPAPDPGYPQPSGTLSVSGVGLHRNLQCTNNYVTISGIDNTVEITGHCSAVTVSGAKNTITVDSTAKILVSGIDNHITYRTGTPQVNNAGFDNTVEPG